MKWTWQCRRIRQSTPVSLALDAVTDKSLLIVDDDRAFCQRLARAMESRGFAVVATSSVSEGLAAIASAPPAFAVIDMRLADGNGLDVMSELKNRRADARAIILTGLRQHRHGGDRGEARRLRLPRQAGRCRRDLQRLDGESARQGGLAGKPDVPPIASAGNIFSASMNFAVATSRRRLGGSTCIDARCNGSSPSVRRASSVRSSPNRESRCSIA